MNESNKSARTGNARIESVSRHLFRIIFYPTQTEKVRQFSSSVYSYLYALGCHNAVGTTGGSLIQNTKMGLAFDCTVPVPVPGTTVLVLYYYFSEKMNPRDSKTYRYR